MTSIAVRQADPIAQIFFCMTFPMTSCTGQLLGRMTVVWNCIGSGLVVLNLGCNEVYLHVIPAMNDFLLVSVMP